MIRRGIGVQSFVAAGGAGTDADAQAFITAAAITDATQQSAINTLVTSLKTYGVWTKMKAIYPFVGGTASAHKFNLKDPRDLDAAFRLVFSGGITHSSTGVLFNGTNGYANTYCNPQTQLGLASNHLSHYSRTQVSNTNTHDMGCETGAGLNFNLFQYYSAITNKGFNDGSYPTNAAVSNTTNTLGLALGTRQTNTSLKLFFNSSLLTTNTTAKSATNYPNFNIYIGATNSANTAAAYSPRQCAFATIGDGLTDTEAANLYTAVQAYQTTLSRNV